MVVRVSVPLLEYTQNAQDGSEGARPVKRPATLPLMTGTFELGLFECHSQHRVAKKTPAQSQGSLMPLRTFLLIAGMAGSIASAAEPVSEESEEATELLQLAEKKFGVLKPAEEKFFHSVADGGIADYRAGDKEIDDPENAENWGDVRVLDADRIAWVCTDPKASKWVTHRGIKVEGARIDGELDLADAKIPSVLGFGRCAFPEGISLRGAEVRLLAFFGSHISHLQADALTVEGNVFLREGFRAEGEVNLRGATIRGQLDCSNGQFINPSGFAFKGNALTVEQGVFLSKGFQAEGEVNLVGAIIGGQLDCTDGQFINPNGFALDGNALTVE